MQVNGATALNAVIQSGLKNASAPAPKPAAPAAPAPVAGGDSDGDNDGSGGARLGGTVNVKA